MKNITHVILGLVFAFLLAGCAVTSETEVSQQVNEQQKVYAINQPVPKFDWSQDRDTFIQIYKLKNEARNTWSVISSMTGVPVMVIPTVGYPIPADSQLTNPLQLSYPSYHESAVVEQPEPNGLFSSKNTDATYVLMVRSNGDIVPIYTELKVTTFPFAVKIVNGQVVEVEGAPSTAKITIKSRSN